MLAQGHEAADPPGRVVDFPQVAGCGCVSCLAAQRATAWGGGQSRVLAQHCRVADPPRRVADPPAPSSLAVGAAAQSLGWCFVRAPGWQAKVCRETSTQHWLLRPRP